MARRRNLRGLFALVPVFWEIAGLLSLPASAFADPSLVRHSSSVLTTGFPAGWHVLNDAVPLTSQSNSILYASNQAIHLCDHSGRWK
jgi:hypothetical protein